MAHSDATEELIDKVITYGRAQGQENPKQVEGFLRQYFDRTTPDDLGTRKVVDLFGQAMAHRELACHRAPQTPNVRVYLPEFETDGWHSTHTAIDIVTDDMPFLVDSVTNELNRHDLRVHLVVHPVLRVRRDHDGTLVEVVDDEVEVDDAERESFLHVEVDRQRAADLERLHTDLVFVLTDVRRAVEDWSAMRDRASAIALALDRGALPGDPDAVAEIADLLRWMADDHFTFLGYREYRLVDRPPETAAALADAEVTRDGDHVLVALPGTGLGVLRDEAQTSGAFARLAPSAPDPDAVCDLLVLAKADARSTVHRRAYLDHIGIKQFGSNGEVIGERVFLGLFEARSHDASVFDVPIIRRRVRAVVDRADLPPEGHSERRLRDILETYPRDELFQTSVDELFDTALGILRLQQRQRVRLFVRRDVFERFVSCLVFVPRDRYNTAVRQRLAAILADAFEGTSVDFTAHITESVLARVHFVVHTAPGVIPEVDVEEVERELVEAVRSWSDDLHDTLVDECGEQEGVALYQRYGAAFPAAYREEFPVRVAAADLRRLHALDGTTDLAMSLYRPHGGPRTALRLKMYRAGSRVSLSEVLPLLEDMGVTVVDERPYAITPADGPDLWIYDFGLVVSEGASREIDNNRSLLLDALGAVWRREAESDGFNRLVLEAGLSWRNVSVLRAYSRYLRQVGSTFSQGYIEECLGGHPDLVRLLMAIFDARFNPDRPGERAADLDLLDLQIDIALDGITSLDDDRILRALRNLLRATTRTNFYQRTADGTPPPYLALKLDPEQIPEVPEPRPRFEIFVYSPSVVGVHLRGGRVARGGIRWSDRRTDFRTEILGLMKAQMVKNSVIVPGGAKGGFVVKKHLSTDDPDGARLQAVAAYRTFISALLDLTDNLVGGTIVPPERVVRYDDDDPYLVVAADKGTATFSDIANAISLERGFWLGDAFASGGSTGYDHKKLGITARGAWESVKRHFRFLHIDPDTTPFTAVGIGDMSGDVFGNGMLLSPYLRLVAAFDHRHVFLDPDPDPELAYHERQRLFELPGSSWDDYDRARLSRGGGVFARSAKSIALSREVRRRLGVDADALTPDEVIQAVLRSPVDLLWNGGIGTYVKATTESHAQVGDKTNDAVRVDAASLRCRVMAEGGNLGFTQRARIEFALAGGRIFTDAIDNSAGVDCSDHEVNIKILLDSVVAAGDLTTKQRDEFLLTMADEVAAAVLQHNYANTEALSIAAAGAASLAEVHGRYIAHLEGTGRIDRSLECLPTGDEMTERLAHNEGLTTPELAQLLAHTKLLLSDAILASDLPDHPFLAPILADYFPHPLRLRFPDQIQRHPLRREIVATCASNVIVNRAGTSFLYRLADETQADWATIARSHLAASAMFDLEGIWGTIERLDGEIAVEVQITMLLAVRQLVERATRWLLTQRRQPIDVAAEVERFAARIMALAGHVPAMLVGEDLRRYETAFAELREHDVPEATAHAVARLDALLSALDIIDVSDETSQPVLPLAAVYFELGHRLRLDWLRDQVGELPRDDRWNTLARSSLRGDLYACQRTLVSDAVRGCTDLGAVEPADVLDAWAATRGEALERYEHVLAAFGADDTPDLAALSVAGRAVHDLAQS